MDVIGDLERLFATNIYPNRVPIAIAGVLALIGLAVVARRRRWDRTVRRHPRQATAGLVVALVIGLPLGWYLGSPLFLSTSVDEPAPVAVAGPAASDDMAEPSGASTAEPSAGMSDVPSDAWSGDFVGADEFHSAEGTARIVDTADGPVLRFEDFRVRNGPDLFVVLSPSADGYADGAVEIARLTADTGNQNYALPADLDLSGFESVVIWCRQFSVEFGRAALE